MKLPSPTPQSRSDCRQRGGVGGGGPQEDCRRNTPLPNKGGGSAAEQAARSVFQPHHGSTEIGEKSMNQLFGCTTPFTFGLIARGPTSWAT
ncbi:hypothetical protein ACVIJ6_002915 [Bradyrhizobium sp. USDA 4369]